MLIPEERLMELENFLPTAEHINALPEGLRKFVHDIETMCDPSGYVAELALTKDLLRAAGVKIGVLKKERDEGNDRAERAIEVSLRAGSERDEAKRVLDEAIRQNAAQVDRLVAEKQRVELKRDEWSGIAGTHAGEIELLRRNLEEAEGRYAACYGELTIAQKALNTPEIEDFSKAVVLEAQHQRNRWGAEHDTGKEPQDWYWLLGYLGGKALRAAIAGDNEKALHHTISTAAACANWHAAISGTSTSMRPGIDPVERGIDAAISQTAQPEATCKDSLQVQPPVVAESATTQTAQPEEKREA